MSENLEIHVGKLRLKEMIIISVFSRETQDHSPFSKAKNEINLLFPGRKIRI
jgi:hypothetical protein